MKELLRYNGKDSNPVYVAYRGRIFDVTQSPVWKGGVHMGRHDAGADLTDEIEVAPHGPDFLERYPEVGMLKEGPVAKEDKPAILSGLLTRYPMLKRHPHPMTVHFPIVFMFSATVFTLIYLATRIAAFETTALNCLGAGLVFIPVAIVTGYFTWYLNYMARPVRAVTMKKWLSLVLLCVDLVVFVWRMAVPDILHPLRGEGFCYLILVLSLLPLVVIIGSYGANLTFPVKKE